jgi:phage recombination protein Bet
MSTNALTIIDPNDETLSRLQTVRNVLAPDLNDQELQLFSLVSQRSGLDPFAKQIYAIKRQGRVTFQTGIDGYRSTAARTGQYEGTSDPEFGPWLDKPFSHPEWARVVAYRFQNGRLVEQPATAYWDEYYPGAKNGVPTQRDQGFMWLSKPRVMLGKVAEAIALRKAFPYVLADLYTDEEMEQAGPPESAPLVEAASQPTVRERVAARRQAIEKDPRGFSLPVDVVMPLTYDNLMTLVTDGQVDPAYASEVFHRLHPDIKGAAELSDLERGALWKEIAEPPKPVEAESAPLPWDPAESARVDAEEATRA